MAVAAVQAPDARSSPSRPGWTVAGIGSLAATGALVLGAVATRLFELARRASSRVYASIGVAALLVSSLMFGAFALAVGG